MSFVETSILPRYVAFGRSHGLSHVQRVIANSLELARRTGADINMVYAIAAYHDLGMSGPRAIHHITGGKILAADARLKKWFSPEQINIMKEAVEDHRASAAWSVNPTRTANGNGSVLTATWRRSTVPAATSVCGFPTPPMRKNSSRCATSSPTRHGCVRSSIVCLMRRTRQSAERLLSFDIVLPDDTDR